MKLKDKVLNDIVQQGGNIAQFVSFSTMGLSRNCRVRGITPGYPFPSIEAAVQAILNTGAPFVNIRSFLPDKPDGNPFFFGRKGFETPVKVAAQVRSLARQGYYVIVNEDIDVNDGGFSGVMFGDVAEFASCDTPRCVEKPDCAVLSRSLIGPLVREVYDHRVSIPFPRDHRVEFSVHPGPVGYLRQPQIIWQTEEKQGAAPKDAVPNWPNRYSRDMGDKAYGLLMAHLLGFMVPRSRVSGRVIPFFEFGIETKSNEKPWVRTCPRTQQPGLFTTQHGWLDPFALMKREDPDASQIASIILQDNIDAVFSGAALTDANGKLVVEGAIGHGDTFMVGAKGVSSLPEHVVDAVTMQWEQALQKKLGPVRFEWVYDTSNTLWVVQFHRGQSESHGQVIFPWDPDKELLWAKFTVESGLDALRRLITTVKNSDSGIILIGNVGITSHFGDILRRNKIPSRLERPASAT